MRTNRKSITNTFVPENKHTCQYIDKIICIILAMDTYAARLRWAIANAELTQSKLAKLVGVKPQTVQYLCDEKNNAQGSIYNTSFAEALGISPLWLETNKGDRFLYTSKHANVEPGPDIKGEVPLISHIQAGEWSEIIDNFAPGDAERWLSCPVCHSEKTFVLRVRGESMHNPQGEQSFRKGELIFVDPGRQPINGSLIVVRLEDEKEATFKKLVIEGNKKYLIALNPAWPERVIEINSNATICGVVIFKGEALC